MVGCVTSTPRAITFAVMSLNGFFLPISVANVKMRHDKLFRLITRVSQTYCPSLSPWRQI